MIECPSCQAKSIKKNGSIHNGKQKYECLACRRQFVENPEHKIISEDTKERVRRTLLERVSLEGICRIFDVSMPWLLEFMQLTFKSLPDDLNATIVTDTEDLVLITLEVDELWSFVGNKKNPQWLWLVIDSRTRQILAFQVGNRSKKTGEALMAKLPEELKKKPSFIQTISQLTASSSPFNSTGLSGKNREKRVTLKDLTAPLDKDAQG